MLLAGAGDGGEMGAFSRFQRSQREDNLRHRLDEFLRVALEVGVFDADRERGGIR